VIAGLSLVVGGVPAGSISVLPIGCRQARRDHGRHLVFRDPI
jgi:hypothetical protein